MDETNLSNLATIIADRLCGTHEHVCVALIRQLAAGQPVSAAHLAATLMMEEMAVGAVLRRMSDVAYDAAGKVVGFGLSLVPTAHQFTISRQTLYTWCALDTFLYTALLGQPAPSAADTRPPHHNAADSRPAIFASRIRSYGGHHAGSGSHGFVIKRGKLIADATSDSSRSAGSGSATAAPARTNSGAR